MTRFSEFTTYRRYATSNHFWLEITVAELFVSQHCFPTAKELEDNLQECCQNHEADIVPPAWLGQAIQQGEDQSLPQESA